jgi:hypothetical protein
MLDDTCISLYELGESTNSIAKRYRTTHHTVKRFLEKSGIVLRTKREAHRKAFKAVETGEIYNGKAVLQRENGRLFIVRNDHLTGLEGRSTQTLVRVNCDGCGRLHLSSVQNRGGRHVCSSVCFSKITSASGNHNWKTGRKLKTSGHVLVYQANHPFARKNFYPEHRLVIEEKIGRYLTPDEVVHHINGVKDDNRLENLCLCSPAEHAKSHNSLIPLLESLLKDGVLRFDTTQKIYLRQN